MDKKTKDQQNLMWAILVVVGVIAAIMLIKKGNEPLEYETQQPKTTTKNQTTTTSPVVKAPAPSSAYTQAVAKYKDRRIQFDEHCVATPNNMTFKNPVTLMLDNRSGRPAKIVISSVSYYLSAWGYKIITINQSSLPKNLLVDCNTSQNVAQILMQR